MPEGSPAERWACLIERERELDRLGGAVESARRGRGALAVVEGHAGIGASRLLEATSESASRAGVTVLRARGSELETGVAHGLVLQLLEPVVAGASPGERRALLADVAALAEPLLTGSPPASRTSPGRLVSPPHHALFRIVANLAASAPALLVVDDAQWADAASLRFLVHLAARLDRLPVAVVVAAHPTFAGKSRALLERLATDPAADLVVPPPLSIAGVASVLRDALGREPDEAFARACAEVTGGVPFLVRELARALARERVAPREASAARVLATGTDSIARTVLVRISRLPRGTLELAQATSVLGDGAPLRHAAELAGLDAPSAGTAVDALAAEGLLRPGEPLRFAHPIVRSSIHAELPRGRRAQLHSQAARLLARDGLPAERIGAQLIPGRAQADTWTVAMLETAAASALRRGAPRAAARYLRRALAEPPLAERRAAVLRAVGDAELLSGDPRALGRFQEAAELAPTARERATAFEAAGRTLSEGGRRREAAAAFDRALAEVRAETGGPATRATRGAGEKASGEALMRTAGEMASGGLSELAVRLEAGYVAAAHLDPALRPHALARLRALAPGRANPRTEGGRALLALAAYEGALEGARRPEVRRLALRALSGAGGAGDPAGGVARRLAVGALVWADELEDAGRTLDLALEEARRRGWAGAVATASPWRARVLLRRGLVTEALAAAETAERECGGLRLLCRPTLAALKAAALIERGELDRAARALAPVAGREEQLDAVTAAEVGAARGRLRLAQGRPRLALRDFVDCGRRLDAIGIANPAVVPWRSGAALACARLGDRLQGRRLAARELELAREADVPRAVAVALRTAALVEEDPRSRLELLREAADGAARAGDILERGHALCRLGTELRDVPSPVGQALEALRQALELAEIAGADALARRARDELAAAGVRAGRTHRVGAGSLTRRERRVADLAAQGLTNRQIAQALFVTVKTVEWHLRNAYVKLGISSRRELIGVLRDAA